MKFYVLEMFYFVKPKIMYREHQFDGGGGGGEFDWLHRKKPTPLHVKKSPTHLSRVLHVFKLYCISLKKILL